MSDIRNAIPHMSEPDKSICKVLIEFYETMKSLEKDAERGGKQATKIVMAMNEIEDVFSRKRYVSITDLIDVIHYTIIKNMGENTIALKELQALQGLVHTKELENYSVEETEYWQFILRQRDGK